MFLISLSELQDVEFLKIKVSKHKHKIYKIQFFSNIMNISDDFLK